MPSSQAVQAYWAGPWRADLPRPVGASPYWGRRAQKAREIADEINAAGHEAIPLPADVLDEQSLHAARQTLLDRWGRVDILINCAGGNRPDATVFGDLTFFKVPREALEGVVGLNFIGTVFAHPDLR